MTMMMTMIMMIMMMMIDIEHDADDDDRIDHGYDDVLFSDNIMTLKRER